MECESDIINRRIRITPWLMTNIQAMHGYHCATDSPSKMRKGMYTNAQQTLQRSAEDTFERVMEVSTAIAAIYQPKFISQLSNDPDTYHVKIARVAKLKNPEDLLVGCKYTLLPSSVDMFEITFVLFSNQTQKRTVNGRQFNVLEYAAKEVCCTETTELVRLLVSLAPQAPSFSPALHVHPLAQLLPTAAQYSYHSSQSFAVCMAEVKQLEALREFLRCYK